jgi:branched-chain amino acid transport system substrate-binding protein
VLSATDDTGREFVAGLHDGLGAKAASMIAQDVYEDSDSSPDGQLQALQTSGAPVFMNFSIGQFATLAIRKAFDLDWQPLQFIPNASISVAASLEPACLNKASGVIRTPAARPGTRLRRNATLGYANFSAG